MRYLRGDVLGELCGELGIRTRSRIAVTEARHFLLIWNLESGVELKLDFKTNMLTSKPKPVPESFFVVFRENTSALLERLTDPDLMPWSEERQTLLSELDYRKVDHPRGPRYPVSALFASLVAHLKAKLDPHRLLGGAVYEPEPGTKIADAD